MIAEIDAQIRGSLLPPLGGVRFCGAKKGVIAAPSLAGLPALYRQRGFPGFAAAIGILLLASSLSNAFGQVSKEYQIKAAMLYKFTKFVEWPARSFADSSSPIVIGVLGSNAFAQELEATVKDRKAAQREIRVRLVQSAGAAKGIQMLFVSAAEEGRFEEIKGALASSVLTVGESERFSKGGGIITFIPEGDNVRFEINTGIAAQGGLKFKAQLLELAKIVRARP